MSLPIWGAAKAREVVVDNPMKIAGMIEKISPVNPNKCPPVIENSDQELRDICYRKAHEMYGEDLPVQVSERLEKELNSIISNGYAVYVYHRTETGMEIQCGRLSCGIQRYR